MKRLLRGTLAALLMAACLAIIGCAEKGEPIQRTPEDKCMVRACSVYF
jgi:hypothetical protein